MSEVGVQHAYNKSGEPLPQSVILDVVRSLGYDPATVQQVHIAPRWVDVTTFADAGYRFTVMGGQSSACPCECGGLGHVRTLVTRHVVVSDPVVDLGPVGKEPVLPDWEREYLERCWHEGKDP